MKKFTIAALAATALIAFSCSDDDNNSNNSAAVSGKWNLTSITSNQPVDGNGDGVSSTNLIAELGSCYTASYIQFGSNHHVTEFLSMPPFEGSTCLTATAEGTYTENGNAITTTVNFDGDSETDSYTKNGNTLTVNIPDFYEIEVTVNNQTTTVTLDATLVFTKA